MDALYALPPFVWVGLMLVVSIAVILFLRRESRKQAEWREQKLAKMEQTRMRIAAKKRAEAEAHTDKNTP